ncbi:hypothetical protein RYX36_004906 [Vicia faba]
MRESCGGRRVTGDLVKMEVGRRRRESFGARSFCRIQNLPESGLGFGCKTLVIESVGGLAEADFLNWKSFPDFMNSFLLFLLWLFPSSFELILSYLLFWSSCIFCFFSP